MINGLTDRIDTACADAGIPAFLREASLVTRTIRINNALGIDANRNAVSHSTLAVVIARRWTARIGFDLCITFLEGIADQRRRAAAKWTVVDRLAHRFTAAYILRTRISAFILYASFVAWAIRAKHAFGMATSYTGRNTL